MGSLFECPHCKSWNRFGDAKKSMACGNCGRMLQLSAGDVRAMDKRVPVQKALAEMKKGKNDGKGSD